MKTCARCHVEKPPESFSTDRRKRDGLDSYCRICKAAKERAVPREKRLEYSNRWRANNLDKVRARGRARYAANPAKAYESQRRYHLKHRDVISVRRRAQTLRAYGLTPEEYDRLLTSQGGGCAICRSKDPQHWSGRFSIDHDHETGRVRGLLCAPCNGALGSLRDDPERLRAALEYLTRIFIPVPEQ